GAAPSAFSASCCAAGSGTGPARGASSKRAAVATTRIVPTRIRLDSASATPASRSSRLDQNVRSSSRECGESEVAQGPKWDDIEDLVDPDPMVRKPAGRRWFQQRRISEYQRGSVFQKMGSVKGH